MKYLTTLRKQTVYLVVSIAMLSIASISFGQKVQPQASPLRPNLGSASTYAVFTGSGTINNTGPSVLTGDIGTDAGSINGFPPGIYTGQKHIADGNTALAKSDLLTAWTVEAAVACDFVLGVGIVDGQSFNSAVYCSGGASTTSGNITFDAKGDANAIFIVKIGGQLDANAGTHILLANQAKAGNIYWFVDGAVNIADNSTFKGTIFARGAISFLGTSSLEGRALANPAGAINLATNIMSIPNDSVPANNITVVRPAQGETLIGGTQNYRITWTGSGIDPQKTLDYSLDSGLTWTKIATITIDSFAYNWNVPDTASTKAIVRITDKNNLSGKSGVFTIISSKSNTIIVVKPTAGEIVNGKTQNYQITWTGNNIAPIKTLEYSLDGGATWTLIGTMNSNALSYSWNVPDTASNNAMVRITDANGTVGKSGTFIIKSGNPNPGTITVLRPAAGEVIAGGTQNYQITWTGSNIAATKTFEYSLDGGATWNFIGVLTSNGFTYTWVNVPNEATTQALIRITDANGVSGTSSMFTITKTPGVGSINSLTLSGLDNKRNIGNSKELGISWTFTPDIGTSMEVEYSLDYTTTWVHIATVPTPTTETAGSTSWTTPATGYYNPVFIRITSTKGMTRMSGPFSIGSNTSVTFTSQKDGYSVTNYPNPVNEMTNISFVLPVASDVTLTLSDELGREVANVISKHFDAGTHTILWNASKLSGGVYNYTLRAGTVTLVGRMIVVK